jgi:hypothetical protein
MTEQWPWPRDDRLDRRSRVAHMYRDLAHDLDAIAATGQAVALDDVLRAYGQTWILDGFPTDGETLLTARELAELADVSTYAVRNWIARWPLQAVAHNDAGVALYRWSDVVSRRKGIT